VSLGEFPFQEVLHELWSVEFLEVALLLVEVLLVVVTGMTVF